MRLHTGSNESETSYNEIVEYADWILKVGDGNIGSGPSGEDGLNEIEIPEENLILIVDDPIEGMVESRDVKQADPNPIGPRARALSGSFLTGLS
ncbi:hypothetical protein ACS0TY_003291 [Phlomoides rotata]